MHSTSCISKSQIGSNKFIYHYNTTVLLRLYFPFFPLAGFLLIALLTGEVSPVFAALLAALIFLLPFCTAGAFLRFRCSIARLLPER